MHPLLGIVEMYPSLGAMQMFSARNRAVLRVSFCERESLSIQLTP
jgi:hypothetical protein